MNLERSTEVRAIDSEIDKFFGKFLFFISGVKMIWKNLGKWEEFYRMGAIQQTQKSLHPRLDIFAGYLWHENDGENENDSCLHVGGDGAIEQTY